MCCHLAFDCVGVGVGCRFEVEVLRLRLRISPAGAPSAFQDFACGIPQYRSKCNEALSRDLWPLDPFESAPMRATSSGMGYCILCAIQLLLEIKDLAELLSGKAGSNSLPLKKLLCGFCWKGVCPSNYYLAAIPCCRYSRTRYQPKH